MSIKVIKPSLSVTIQDAGREGYYHLGIPPSGAMDQYSMQAANLLVGNNPTQAVLECTFMGPELEFQQTCLVAVTGARMLPKVDGVAQALDTAFVIKEGQRLSFDFVKGGARGYIAVGGGFAVPLQLGSQSTYTTGSLGGFKGRKLQSGDVIPLNTPTKLAKEGVYLPESLRQKVGSQVALRVMSGLYYHRLTQEAADFFFSEEWMVGSEADRMGYRIKCSQSLSFKEREQPFGAGADPSNIVDACYPIGSIQIPGGLEPIILHRDAVSGGGYAMIGTVISADMDLIGQMQPNQKIVFTSVTLKESLQARKDYQKRLHDLYAFFM